jgi:hypothetical protein
MSPCQGERPRRFASIRPLPVLARCRFLPRIPCLTETLGIVEPFRLADPVEAVHCSGLHQHAKPLVDIGSDASGTPQRRSDPSVFRAACPESRVGLLWFNSYARRRAVCASLYVSRDSRISRPLCRPSRLCLAVARKSVQRYTMRVQRIQRPSGQQVEP